MKNDILAVNEIFGPTFQGEGKNIGLPVVFLRLAGCNQACVWCDTPYSWDWSRFDPKTEVHKKTTTEVFTEIQNFSNIGNLVISGGEPMLQQAALWNLCYQLKNNGWKHIEVETAGSIKTDCVIGVDLFTVSIKLAHSGNPLKKRINPSAIKSFKHHNSVYKFVVDSLDDFTEIDQLVSDYQLTNVYIMPQGIDTPTLKERSEMIASATLKRGYFLTTRLQVILYGHKRAV